MQNNDKIFKRDRNKQLQYAKFLLIFDDSDYHNKIEQVQQPIIVKKINARHIGTFVYDEHYPD